MAFIVKGLSSSDNGIENARILQEAIDKGGEIIVADPGFYRLAETIYIGDHTHIKFEKGVYFVRMPSPEGINGNAFINKGAFTRTPNVDISIEGLYLNVNGVEHTDPSYDNKIDKTILGLRAHVSFLYIKDLVLKDIVIPDLLASSYGIQICNFENVLVERIRMEGDKDGIHFGPGKHFVLRHGVFRTHDDPVALNAFDYSGSNPNPGWIEDGLIEDCIELDDNRDVGFCFFSRHLCGGWQDWFEGMMVQQSDAAVHNGVLYRVRMKPSFERFPSTVPPTHEKGFDKPDTVVWYRTMNNEGYTAGCRNIHYKNIVINRNRRCAFGFIQEVSEYCRSYFENSESPLQENITFENIRFNGDVEMFAWVNSPLDNVTIKNSHIGNAKIVNEPVMKDRLIYPEGKVFIENTEVTDEFIIKNKDTLKAVKL